MKIINNYRDLKMSQYLDILEISRDNDREELDKQVNILSILSGLSTDDLLDLPIGEYVDGVKQMRFLETPSKDDAIRVAKNYIRGGMELVPVTDLRKITTSQYIDFQNFSKEGDKNIVEIVSCFLIPKGHHYCKDYDILDVQKTIREEMSVAEVLSLSAFFLNKYKALIRNSLIFCKREAKRRPKTEKTENLMSKIREVETLWNDGDGLPMWMQ